MFGNTCFLCVVILSWLCPGAVVATTPTHPDDPTAQYLGSFKIAIVGTENGTTCSDQVIVWQLSSGRTDYVLDPNAISISAPCTGIDGLSTSALFSMLAQAAVTQGVAAGFSLCPANCSDGSLVRVYFPACVNRTGSGCSTSFPPCGSNYSTRDYTVCCPTSGATLLTLLSSFCPSCTGVGCSSTCQ